MEDAHFEEAQRLQKLIILGLANNCERARYFLLHQRILHSQPFIEVDKEQAIELLKWIHLNKPDDFPELKDKTDWADLSLDDVTESFIGRLRNLSEELANKA